MRSRRGGSVAAGKEAEMSERPKFYITTPIYYASGNLHIGHTYSTVVCDAIARYKRMCGWRRILSDGYGRARSESAGQGGGAGQDPARIRRRACGRDQKAVEADDVSYDKFIRTTDDYHVRAVQEIFRRLYEKGDIYKSVYKGKYCKPCESFWTESQLVNGCCPDCGRPVEYAEEESYFLPSVQVCASFAQTSDGNGFFAA